MSSARGLGAPRAWSSIYRARKALLTRAPKRASQENNNNIPAGMKLECH